MPSRHVVNDFGSQPSHSVADIVRQSKFMVNLSYNESFGLAMTEAMAMGIPVIATRTDGSLEQIEDNKMDGC